MTPVISHSSSPISIVPRATFNTRKNTSLRRCCFLKTYAKRTSYPQNCILPLSVSVRLFPHIRTCDLHRKPLLKVVSASGVDLAVGESDSSVAVDQESSVQSKEDSSVQTRRTRSGRKSDLPPVKNEDLVPGATFIGKVRSIQPFGAFVDFGAFTEGLVHVSQLSDDYVKNVGDVVSVGEEVEVRLIEANTKTGRVSLSMKSESSSGTDSDRKGPLGRNSQNSNQRRDRPRERTDLKFEVGQDFEGTVKTLTTSGSFISLPDGEEGFLPQSEEGDVAIGGIMGETTLEVGQKVSVRVLRISRGQATLTVKKSENNTTLEDMASLGTVRGSNSPFLYAFRKNKLISAYLDMREKQREEAEALKNAEIAGQNIVGESVLASDESVSAVDQVSDSVDGISDLTEVKSDGRSIIDEVQIETPIPEAAVSSPLPVEIEKAEVDSVDQVTETEIDSFEVVEVKSDGGSIIDEVQIETPILEVAVPSLPPVEVEKDEISSPSPIEEAKVENNISSSSLEKASEG